MTTAPVVGIAVFAALLIFDLIAHKKTKLGRRIPDWIFLCAFAFGLVFSFVNLMFPLINTGSVSVTGRYTAYRYLMDGEGELARNAAIQDAEGRSKAVDLIDLLSYAVEGDYEQTFYKANEYIGSNSLSARESENVYELLDAAKDALGSDADPGEKVKEIVENCYNQAGIRETQDLIDYYELHKK